MRKKLWVGGGAIAALLVVALAVLFLVDFDSPRLGKAVLDQVAKARVPPEILDLVDDGGWVTVPVRVTGDLASPRVSADGDGLREMGRRAVATAVRQQVEKGVGRVLGKLFGNR